MPEALISIPGRLHTVANGGYVTGADEIYDDTLAKTQATINSEAAYIDTTGGSSAVIPEFDPYSDTVWNKAQTLSSTQKAQVKANVGIVENTAGATDNANTKLFLVGTEYQGGSFQSYTNEDCYIGEDNCLYSGGDKTATIQDVSVKADKVNEAVNNNLAALNENGNLKDSGKSLLDLVLASKYAADIANITENNINANGLAMCMAIVHLSGVSTMTAITNQEWYYVILDSQDKVLCGIKKDGLAYVHASIKEIIVCIIDSYNT